jgi:hypothetical protein
MEQRALEKLKEPSRRGKLAGFLDTPRFRRDTAEEPGPPHGNVAAAYRS